MTKEELEKENAELNKKLSDVLECFISTSSGDDFEMAESAREVMEVLNIRCYRHGEVKSKLTKAKEIMKILLKYDRGQFFNDRRIYEKYMRTRVEAEQFISEVEK